jgi:predicted nucleic acid-binding protein
LHKIKAHPAQRDKILRAFLMAGKLAIEIVEVDQQAVVDLAEETGLTTYDASYLWLARQMKGKLMTLDRKMRRFAESIL